MLFLLSGFKSVSSVACRNLVKRRIGRSEYGEWSGTFQRFYEFCSFDSGNEGRVIFRVNGVVDDVFRLSASPMPANHRIVGFCHGAECGR